MILWFASVQSGKIDMSLAGMTVTEERKQNVDFTDSYATGVQVIIVKRILTSLLQMIWKAS